MALNINGTTGVSGVDGSVSAPALTGTDSNTGITFPSADTIKFSTGGVERMSITNSGITGISGGITEYDAWVITSNFTTDASSPDYFNSNWARQDLGNNLFEKIGTGMTESSGIFTFPSTGKYQINGVWALNSNQVNDSNVVGSIYATHNNSSYTMVARATGFTSGADKYALFAQVLIDVTDTSQVKVRLASDSSNGVIFEGQNGAMKTGIIFKKIGDT